MDYANNLFSVSTVLLDLIWVFILCMCEEELIPDVFSLHDFAFFVIGFTSFDWFIAKAHQHLKFSLYDNLCSLDRSFRESEVHFSEIPCLA